MRTAKEQREIRFIYNKHNKSTKYKLEIDDNRIVFPENIRLIINKREKRTNEEAEELKCFREKVLSEMAEESAQIEKTVEMELLKKKRDRIERIRIAQDKRNQNDSSKKKHIGIWITLGSKSRISREHYAEINKKSSLSTPQTAEYYRKHPDKRSELFEDEECSIYTDSYCERHRAKCLENYDNNMRYFDSLNPDEFQKEVLRLIISRKDIRQVVDLRDYDGVQGVYILILDDYKQMYIGQSIDIKKRILRHWSTTKAFDRLIFGNVNNSILSIDSFGPLDTARIFACQLDWRELDSVERQLINKVDKRFILNRTAGGIKIEEDYDQLELLSKANYRDM
ncbi:MAG: GIY-YIG nuclease family protein [Clostridiales bacterium]|nr:GIY-YIG nuclease family protein [Clostridiales bacterium]MDY5348385.1 GIY-YIG nuclease family protein [Candidatus Ventricola sp.]MDY5514773.1 GIY-YIG nuclease family protein [Candidatus Ventricola sp.]